MKKHPSYALVVLFAHGCSESPVSCDERAWARVLISYSDATVQVTDLDFSETEAVIESDGSVWSSSAGTGSLSILEGRAAVLRQSRNFAVEIDYPAGTGFTPIAGAKPTYGGVLADAEDLSWIVHHGRDGNRTAPIELLRRHHGSEYWEPVQTPTWTADWTPLAAGARDDSVSFAWYDGGAKVEHWNGREWHNLGTYNGPRYWLATNVAIDEHMRTWVAFRDTDHRLTIVNADECERRFNDVLAPAAIVASSDGISVFAVDSGGAPLVLQVADDCSVIREQLSSEIGSGDALPSFASGGAHPAIVATVTVDRDDPRFGNSQQQVCL